MPTKIMCAHIEPDWTVQLYLQETNTMAKDAYAYQQNTLNIV